VVHVRLSPDNLAHMRKAKLDAGLRALAPQAAAQIPHLQKTYPLFRTIYRARVENGAVQVDPKPERDDIQAAGGTVHQLRQLLGE
jgi:hypothetical protein